MSDVVFSLVEFIWALELSYKNNLVKSTNYSIWRRMEYNLFQLMEAEKLGMFWSGVFAHLYLDSNDNGLVIRDLPDKCVLFHQAANEYTELITDVDSVCFC